MNPKNIKNLYEMVYRVLEDHPYTRNSDIELRQRIWIRYFPNKIVEIDNDYAVRFKDEFNLPNQDDIKRIRAKIQNDEGKFIPTNWEVAKQRKWQESAWKIALGYTENQRETNMRDQEFKNTVSQKPLFDINNL